MQTEKKKNTAYINLLKLGIHNITNKELFHFRT